jgi:iron complex transport system ATP-binding protein
MTVRLLFQEVTVRYGAHEALAGVSGMLRGGEMLALLGPNGSGKSTLLRAAAGLQRHAGRVTLEAPRGARVGFLPQDNGARAALTVLETVLLGRLRALGIRVPAAEVARAGAALARLGIGGLAPRLLSELSGGQRQLVFLAQILVDEPAVLLLDEPTSALDLRNQLAPLSLLRDLAHGAGLAVMVALHDLNAALRFADRVLVLRQGRAVAEGAPPQVLTAELIAEVYGVRAAVARTESGGLAILPESAIEAGR